MADINARARDAETIAKEKFVTTRIFDAPREQVWKAWTEAERLGQWWGPKGFAMGVINFNLRPDGIFHYNMRTPDGHEMWGKFVYRDIAAPERIVFVSSFADAKGILTRCPFSSTWPLEVLNTLSLSKYEGGTALTLQGGPINATEEEHKTFEAGFESMKQGFSGTFDQLAEYLARA
jgi:uncharacterized protein YndB with AHSA1/START domain